MIGTGAASFSTKFQDLHTTSCTCVRGNRVAQEREERGREGVIKPCITASPTPNTHSPHRARPQTRPPQSAALPAAPAAPEHAP